MLSRKPLRILVLAIGLMLTFSARAGIYDDILAAANRDDTATVIDLLRRGMDVNTADPAGNTLLMIAAGNNNVPLLDFLLGNRSNILKKNKYGDSALMFAALRGHVEATRRLLAAHAPADGEGWNAIHYAAYAGHADILRLLIQADADVDAVAPNGQTALMLAAANGKLEAVKVLVDDGDADLDLEDADGQTALMLATKGGYDGVVEYLKESGAIE